MTEYTTMKVAEKFEQGFNWTTWLAGATISTSTWSHTPEAGLTRTGATNTTTNTSVFGEATAAGTYRLRNDVTDSAGRKGWDEIVIAVEDVSLAYGYLSTNDAEARLWGRFRIQAEISPGDLLAASNELDKYGGPWIGSRKVDGQALAFPRSIKPDGTDNTSSTAPDDILDAVAFLAYDTVSDEGPAVTSESVLDRSVTYATPKTSQTISRVLTLISPYQLKVGQRVGSSYVKREYGDGEEPPWW